ncbi:uncharacterized protein BDR25DRAFT_393297 [Lindgomyces ingoldianus]|uniref:Uncharacterized protein n=1 Tax=Lindgomyces ingoldianus TaxID=673940 RepID=A0ACB6R0B1_9PLEO|nr:uncharacterized protein BDR25DRAFT_393297 [Lindgomyces ingoldianus]KAF2471772.1 hypothetical protein BDR25DRAFT_393297 [Lindgomyces ingoldianus]
MTAVVLSELFPVPNFVLHLNLRRLIVWGEGDPGISMLRGRVAANRGKGTKLIKGGGKSLCGFLDLGVGLEIAGRGKDEPRNGLKEFQVCCGVRLRMVWFVAQLVRSSPFASFFSHIQRLATRYHSSTCNDVVRKRRNDEQRYESGRDVDNSEESSRDSGEHYQSQKHSIEVGSGRRQSFLVLIQAGQISASNSVRTGRLPISIDLDRLNYSLFSDKLPAIHILLSRDFGRTNSTGTRAGITTKNPYNASGPEPIVVSTTIRSTIRFCVIGGYLSCGKGGTPFETNGSYSRPYIGSYEGAISIKLRFSNTPATLGIRALEARIIDPLGRDQFAVPWRVRQNISSSISNEHTSPCNLVITRITDKGTLANSSFSISTGSSSRYVLPGIGETQQLEHSPTHICALHLEGWDIDPIGSYAEAAWLVLHRFCLTLERSHICALAHLGPSLINHNMWLSAAGNKILSYTWEQSFGSSDTMANQQTDHHYPSTSGRRVSFALSSYHVPPPYPPQQRSASSVSINSGAKSVFSIESSDSGYQSSYCPFQNDPVIDSTRQSSAHECQAPPKFVSSNNSGYRSGSNSIPIPISMRELSTREEDAAWNFIEHARRCAFCRDPYEVYWYHEQLCTTGSELAQEVAKVIFIRDEEVWSKVDYRQVSLGIQFEPLRWLLKSIEQSCWRRGVSFVSLDTVPRSSAVVQNPDIYNHIGRPLTRRRQPSSRGKSSIYTENGYEGGNDEPATKSDRKVRKMDQAHRHHVEEKYATEPVEKWPSSQQCPPAPKSPGEGKSSAAISKEVRQSRYTYLYGPRFKESRWHRNVPLRPQAREDSRPVDIDSSPIQAKRRPCVKHREPQFINEEHDDNSNDSPIERMGKRWVRIKPSFNQSQASPPPQERTEGTEKKPENSPRLSKDLDSRGYMVNRTGAEQNEDCQTEDLSDKDRMGMPSERTERLLSTALVQIKELLVCELVDYAFEATDGLGGSNPSEKRQRESSSSSSSQASDHPPQRKRARGGGRDPGDGGDDSGDDGDNNDRPPKKNGKKSPFGVPHRRLKCPFFQRQPEKFARAACRGAGFADMAKLKDHIKRVHTQPLRCLRCWKEMESEDAYTAHQQADTYCNKRPEPPDDRIRPQMLNKLDFKKAPYAHAKTTEEKWKILYRLLFPNDGEVPSPYDQHAFTPRLERVLFEVLEEELTRELAPALEPILNRIKQRIPSIIQNCKLRLLNTASESDTTYSPSSLATFTTIDSEQRGPCTQSKQTSGTISPFSGSYAANAGNGPLREKGRGTQHGHSSPSRSSTDGFQDSHHESSPESIFDSQVTPPDLVSGPSDFNALNATCPGYPQIRNDYQYYFPTCLPNEQIGNLTPSTTQEVTINQSSTSKGKQPQWNSFPILGSSNASGDTNVFHEEPKRTASRDCDTPSKFNNPQPVSDCDYVPNGFDFDLEQFFNNF